MALNQKFEKVSESHRFPLYVSAIDAGPQKTPHTVDVWTWKYGGIHIRKTGKYEILIFGV